MISTALMKEQLKRNWPVMFLILLGFAFFIVLPTLLPGGNTPERAQDMLDLLAMRNPVMLGAAVIVPFAVAMLMFSFLFSPKATTAYQNLSDSKGQLFWSNAVSGMILLVIPLIIVSLFLLIQVRIPNPLPTGDNALTFPTGLLSGGLVAGSILNTFPVVVAFFFRNLISFMFFYALWLFTFSLCGKWVMSAVIFGLLPVIPLLVHRLIMLIGSFYVFGYYPVDFVDYRTTLAFSNPVAWYHSFAESVAQPVFFLIYSAITLVLFGLASACFSSRKIEKADNPIVFTAFRNVFVFIVSVIGMVLLGGYVSSLLTGRWFLYYGFVLGFAITFCIVQMVFGKTFSIASKIKWILPLMGVVVALYGIMLLVTMFGMRGFTYHVPSEARVSGVYMSGDSFAPDRNAFDTDSRAIAEARFLHWHIVNTADFRSDLTRDERRDMSSAERRDHRLMRRDNRRELRDAFWEANTGDGRRFEDNGGQMLYITYLLDNGNTVYRRYALPAAFLVRLGVVGH
ncbi:MAG: hypothetical protein FWC20_12540 [Oscillospiraceae bacterium]|nr:hypothetical protein [Oscillospiraceae bacterium]MCL2280213.1 hypothetical protein [Oscillospiraceae bacterium]